ncbi:DUF4173 domain-containing protein [Lacinutrix sp. Hel_I_90]|uniref:DUF4153 domain-containing protein n=1 Tax=Lacinutrix sp. Hel_I_90 TaxID=1249999 RepID=UPI0005C879C3|nr:DUF4173 domain-containing protein [Lacinutrix sp. Hel_I_90]
MKHLLLIIASLSFSTLFYQQQIGLNLSLFSIITILILWWQNKSTISQTKTLLFVATYLITAIAVFINSSSLAIIANCISFFTLIGATSSYKTSIYIQWLNGIYTAVAGYFHRRLEPNEHKEQVIVKKEIDVLHWVKLIGIPLIFSITFILLYKNGNPIFSEIIEKIDFSFINLHWILLTVLGFYLFNNLIQPVTIEPATQTDLNTKNNLVPSENSSEEKLNKESQLGTVLLTLLNILIVFYIITDLSYLLSAANTTTAAHLSIQLHNGINALIASILVAIITIILFFRGDLNFYKKNKMIKSLTYVWILLNVILVALIAIKNLDYSTSFGFTYKRIGVLVYLVLTLVGLITTFYKVFSIKNLWYLFRINTQLAFAMIVVCSAVNWDKTITNFNINHAVLLDMDYLINLSNSNAIILKEHASHSKLSTVIETRINTKFKNYTEAIEARNWQEFTLINFKEDLHLKTNTH